MKLLFDSFPVILFFIAYYGLGKDIYLATGVTIVATLIQVAWARWKHGSVDKMLWFSLALVVVFGGLTLWLHNPTFIKWKPTVLYWGFALALLGGVWVFKRNLIRALMEKQMSLPDAVWGKLNLSWAAFFTFMGLLNLYVAYTFSEEIWVNFKLFGATGLMFVFVIAQALIISRHIPPDTEKDGESKSP
ncbi:MAG: septation protein A [Betaproteobacteria bacterium]|nr:septation protein A [Betaproteobacteria bacterium]